jgi:hypothetical protein
VNIKEKFEEEVEKTIAEMKENMCQGRLDPAAYNFACGVIRGLRESVRVFKDLNKE